MWVESGVPGLPEAGGVCGLGLLERFAMRDPRGPARFAAGASLSGRPGGVVVAGLHSGWW
jgi:hypothetical protein